MKKNDFFKYLLLSGGNAAGLAELETEALPYVFGATGHRLRNYRIYGAEGGVGDLQENGKYLISVTVQGKNKLKNYAQSQTKNGLNITVSPEGYVIFNGTAAANTFATSQSNFSAGENDILSGSPSGGSNSSYSIRLRNADTNEAVYDYGNGVSVSGLTGNIEIRIVANTVCDNLIFKPMIRPSNTSAEYEMYHEPQTIGILLDSPLEDGEYIDFKEQKRYPGGNTISLPVIPTIVGTNIFTVDTEVQPSKVYVQGNISEIETVSVQNLQANMQSLQPLSPDDDNLQPDVMPIDRPVFDLNGISETALETDIHENGDIGGNENSE